MITIRRAQPDDAHTIITLIEALARYEREPDAVRVTKDDILHYGFGEQPRFYCLLAELDGIAVGFALYFFSYSTWEGKPGLYLEDLFVYPEHRAKGIGKALMIHLAQTAIEQGCTRFHWQVLDWNTLAIDFYKALGAVHMEEWHSYRISGKALQLLAEERTL